MESDNLHVENHEQEPMPIGDLVEDPSYVVGYEDDPERAYQAQLTDLQNELTEYEEEVKKLFEEVQLDPEDAGLRQKLEEARQGTLAIRADIIEHKTKHSGETAPDQ